MKKYTLYGLLVLGLATAVAVAGCGGDSSSSSTSSTGEGGSAASEESPSVKVLYLVPTLQDEAYTRELGAAEAEAGNFPNAEVDFSAGSGRLDGSDLISKIQNATTTGVEAIAIDCGGACEQVKPALEAAIGDGVSVVAVGQPVPGLEGQSSFVSFDEVEAAVPAGEFMDEQLKGKGEVAIIRCVIGNAVTDAREEGFVDALKGSEIEIVARADAECDPAKARTRMENFLTANPDLAGVYSDTDVALVGALEAIAASGKELVVVGHDGQIPILEDIEQGTVDATVRFSNEDFGKLGVKAAIEAAEGKPVDEIVPIPIYPMVTKENVQEVLNEVEAEKK